MVTTVQCPQCKKPVIWNAESKWKPFCCERCKLIDLGEWASESHRIAGPENIDERDMNDDYNPSDYH